MREDVDSLKVFRNLLEKESDTLHPTSNIGP